jgi:hypothetical protein
MRTHFVHCGLNILEFIIALTYSLEEDSRQ